MAERGANPKSEGQGRAFGKVIFFGEHAVVYGVPAIAAGISRGVTARVVPARRDSIVFSGRELEASHELYQALAALRESAELSPTRLELSVELPLGAGLGSSASMAVAVVRALSDLWGIDLSERRAFLAAQAWESIFHGTPSGIDVAAARKQGLISFKKGSEPVDLTLARPLFFAVAQAGPPASTKKMVEGVARFKQRNPAQFEKTLSAIESLSQNARLLLRQGDLESVGKLMDLNQMLLAGWMLSTEEIENAVRSARNSGALGAKLTGAGGGGCVLALCRDEAGRKSVLAMWESQGIPCFSADVETSQGHAHGA